MGTQSSLSQLQQIKRKKPNPMLDPLPINQDATMGHQGGFVQEPNTTPGISTARSIAGAGLGVVKDFANNMSKDDGGEIPRWLPNYGNVTKEHDVESPPIVQAGQYVSDDYLNPNYNIPIMSDGPDAGPRGIPPELEKAVLM